MKVKFVHHGRVHPTRVRSTQNGERRKEGSERTLSGAAFGTIGGIDHALLMNNIKRGDESERGRDSATHVCLPSELVVLCRLAPSLAMASRVDGGAIY